VEIPAGMVSRQPLPGLFRQDPEAETKSEISAAVTKNTKGKAPAVPAEPEKKETRVEIDLDGINNRVTVLPGAAGRYRIIGADEAGLLYISGSKLMRFNLTDEKSEEIMDQVMTALLSADKKMAMYRSGSDTASFFPPSATVPISIIFLMR